MDWLAPICGVIPDVSASIERQRIKPRNYGDFHGF